MFEGIKIFSTLECFRSFIPKSWTNIYMTKQVGRYQLYEMDILIAENYLLIENYPL